MKKYLGLLLGLFALAGCGGYIKNENGSQYIKQLDGEPIGCIFLYKIESEVSVYDAEDARRYLENRIADQARPGNAYWLVSQRTRPNQWVLFGPERAFVLAANVYECPNIYNVKTARTDEAMPEYDAKPCSSWFCGVPEDGKN
ncbi:MAG: hypothetical protein J6T27_01205 [Alphaproteobacteria bacterium]|jgi:hypothetical protein|nr:hypothetical protein [Alphaproteobacteria bacterium]